MDEHDVVAYLLEPGVLRLFLKNDQFLKQYSF
jgi:hypothetical protein